MSIEDYAGMYQLWRDISGMGMNSLDDSEEGISKYLERNPNTCFVAVKEKRIVGVILSGHDGRRGFIYHTAVLVSERKQGIGNALLSASLAALETEGITKVALVVFSKNEVGNRFWEQRGFTIRPDLTYRNKALKNAVRIDT